MEFNWKKRSNSWFECEMDALVLVVCCVDGEWIADLRGARNYFVRAKSTSEEEAKKRAEGLYLETIQPILREGARREAGAIFRMLSDAIRAHKAMADEDRVDRDNYIAHDAAADALESARSMIVHLGASEEATDQRLLGYVALRLEMDQSLMTENHLQRLRALAGVPQVEDRSGSTLVIVSKKELTELYEKTCNNHSKMLEDSK